MRRIALLLSIIGACRPAPSPSAPGATALAIRHVTVIDVDAPDDVAARRHDRTIIVAGDSIQSVAADDSAAIPSGATIVDGTGKFLIPGLWDAHTHLTFGGRGSLEVMVANGVTGARDLGGRFDDLQLWRAEIRAGTLAGPIVYAAGPNVEGAWWLDAITRLLRADSTLGRFPFLERSPRLRLGTPGEATAIVDSAKRLGADVIKFRNVQGDEFRALAAAARRVRLPLTGHAPRGVSVAEAADSGMQSLEHAETVMQSLGDAGDAERRRQFTVMARRGTALTPTLIADASYRLTPDSVAYAAIADTLGHLDPRRRTLGKALAEMWEFGLDIKRFEEPGGDWSASHRRQVDDVRRARESGVTLLVDTDVGVSLVYPGYAVHDELRLLVDEGGLSPLEALRAATVNPAGLFRVPRTDGTIQTSNRADLVLLAADPLTDIRNSARIDAVILGGKLLRRAALDSLTADAERLARTGPDGRVRP